MSIGKKIGIAIGAILFVICLSIDIWYGYILFFGKEKILSKTFKVSTLTLADGTTTNIFEVEYFANKDNSGHEAFEIKFTNFMDEDRDQTFIQGLQYIADTSTSSIDFGFSHNHLGNSVFESSSGKLGWKDKYYSCQNTYIPSEATDVFNYMSSDGETYLKSTNPIDVDTGYKIQIGEDIYLMRFKGTDTPKDKSTEMWTERVYHNIWTADEYHTLYCAYDVNYFVKLLYESVKTAELGSNSDIIFEWGNLFNYYKYDSTNKVYNEEPTDYTSVKLVSGDIKSYYSVRIKTHEYGLQRSEDSMFGSFLGNSSFSLNGDYVDDTYFIGRTVVNCDISNFDFIIIDDNNIALKLSGAFIDYYSKFKSSIVLSVVIDLDLINELGYVFNGFSTDNGLDNFDIYECYSVSGGEKIEDFTNTLKVVTYD